MLLLSTTGTLATVIINDLGKKQFVHPVVNFDLLTEFYPEELRLSADLAAALTAGYITLELNGDPITTALELNNSIFIKDERFETFNVVHVKQNPGIGEFSSINAALDNITTNAISNPFKILVGPGIFIENTVISKPYVLIEGTGEDITIIEVDAVDKNVIEGADNSGISNCTLRGATDSGFAAIYYSSATATTLTSFQVRNVRFGNNDILVKVEAPANPTFVDLSGCIIGSTSQFNYGFVATNTGTGAGRILVKNTNTIGMTAPFPTELAVADGPGCEIIMNSAQFRVPTPSSGIGIRLSNGGRGRLIAVNLRGFTTGVYMENVGAAPTIIASSINFEDCTQDINIEHPGSDGTFFGIIDRTSSFIDPSSTIVINTEDRKIIRVATLDTDFNSVEDAINNITDASPTNRYLISVGPGIFLENTLTLIPYVDIVGAGNQLTFIKALNPANDLIITTGNASISNVKLGGSNAVGKSIFVHSGNAIPGPLYVNDCIFTDTDTILTQRSTIGPSSVVITDCAFDALSAFKTGFDVHDNGTNPCILILGRFLWFANAMLAAGFLDFIKTSGALSKCVSTNLFVGTDVGNFGGNCFHALDGSSINISNLQSHGFNRAIYAENSGAASSIIATATQLNNNITDILIEHTESLGSFQGVADMNKTTINSLTFNIAIQDYQAGGFNISNNLKIRFNNGTLTDVSTLIIESSTMGVMNGGVLSDGGGLDVNIAAGSGYFEQFPDNDVIVKHDWSSLILTLPADTDNYIYFNNNAILTASSAVPDSKYNIILGRVVTNTTGIEFIDASPYVAEHTSNLLSRFAKHALGSIYVTGSIVTENITPLHLDISSGYYHFAENKYLPSGADDVTFTSIYGDGGGDFIKTITDTVDNVNYDDGSGVLVPLTPGFYAKHSLYLIGEGINEKYYLVYAQNEYDSLLLAQEANIPSKPTYFRDSVVLIAGIIVQEGNTNIVQIRDLRPVIGFKSEGVNASADHGSLLGLFENDHPQYLLRSGDNAMTGDLNVGGNDITNVVNINTIPIVNFLKLNGNAYGANSVFGLTDAFSLAFRTNNIDRILIGSTGTITLSNLGTGNNKIVLADTNGLLSSITTVNTAALVTSNTGVPSWASGTTANRVLRSNGTTISFSQVDLNNDVTGILPSTNGGTGFASYTIGDILYADTATTLAKRAAVAIGSVLGSVGVGSAPAYLAVDNGLTATDSTFRLGGALTAATSITGAFNLNLGTIGSRLSALNTVSNSANIRAGLAASPTDFSNISLSGTQIILSINDSAVSSTITQTSSSLKLNFESLSDVIEIDINGVAVVNNGTNLFIIKDDYYGKGIVYADDYSGSFTPESLVTMRWVQDQAYGLGSVTNFSAGELFPLFITSVSNPTTTPALSFALSDANANTWFGNNTGGATAPSFNSAGTISKTDDTNVTLTLGGTPANSVLNSVSFTLGWTGILDVSRGGTGVSTFGGTNSILYTTTTDTLSSITTSNDGVLVTSGTGVPSIGSTLPNAVQDNITRLGTVVSGIITNAVTATFTDILFTLQDDGDTSKQLKFELSNISSATIRTLSAPDYSGMLVARDRSFKNTLTTINNTITTITTISTTSDKGYLIEVRGTSRRVSGTGAGANGDTNGYVRTSTIKNVGGTLTIVGTQSSYTDEEIGTHNLTITTSGTNILIQVTGSTNNTVDWVVQTETIEV